MVKLFKLCIYRINFLAMYTIAPNHDPDIHHVVGNGAGTEIRAGDPGVLLAF